MPHHWRPLAHERNSIFKCKQTYSQWSPRTRKIWLHNDEVRGDILHLVSSHCGVSCYYFFTLLLLFIISPCPYFLTRERPSPDCFVCCNCCQIISANMTTGCPVQGKGGKRLGSMSTSELEEYHHTPDTDLANLIIQARDTANYSHLEHHLQVRSHIHKATPWS